MQVGLWPFECPEPCGTDLPQNSTVPGLHARMAYIEYALCQPDLITLEPIYKLRIGVLNPDLVDTKVCVSYIIDSEVVGDIHEEKFAKYYGRGLIWEVQPLRCLSGSNNIGKPELQRHLVTK